MTEYPYMVSNNKIAPIITGLQAAAKPPKFTHEFLRNMGFSSTNDRASISLFKRLGFLTEDSAPTVYYDQLRDRTTYKRILANRIRDLYSELFTINTQIYGDTEQNIKGAISRVTGSDETGVNRVYATFKALCALADFVQDTPVVPDQTPIIETIPTENIQPVNTPSKNDTEFHYNFQIHLPATTDISVYNAIFKSLKDNLLI